MGEIESSGRGNSAVTDGREKLERFFFKSSDESDD
ncbi:uncharacterized protein G2W53_007978 [Senna tora]|uniref:Uncharacterized protein n=1 Tax=Senna tora TaxID=362788 RepID=A0A834X723_9FABA|nr:uncharacterized protein G2W53_007978 [Senna tora]